MYKWDVYLRIALICLSSAQHTIVDIPPVKLVIAALPLGLESFRGQPHRLADLLLYLFLAAQLLVARRPGVLDIPAVAPHIRIDVAGDQLAGIIFTDEVLAIAAAVVPGAGWAVINYIFPQLSTIPIFLIGLVN